MTCWQVYTWSTRDYAESPCSQLSLSIRWVRPWYENQLNSLTLFTDLFPHNTCLIRLRHMSTLSFLFFVMHKKKVGFFLEQTLGQDLRDVGYWKLWRPESLGVKLFCNFSCGSLLIKSYIFYTRAANDQQKDCIFLPFFTFLLNWSWNNLNSGTMFNSVHLHMYI